MIQGLHIKVCGITNLMDAEAAASCGADFLGFILYPKSPRFLSLEQYCDMANRLPLLPKVAVLVQPAANEIREVLMAGFDYLQIHFLAAELLTRTRSMLRSVPREKLWIAPKAAPGQDIDAKLFSLADTIMLDAHDKEKFGGTGHTGDWKNFAKCKERYPEKTWILAGGLNKDNVTEAIRQTGASWVDVNSGVETAPGIKDGDKLREFFETLQQV